MEQEKTSQQPISSGMAFDKVYTVKTEISKEQFLREALISITKNADSPIDIASVKFGEVEERYCETLGCKAYVHTKYTASVGYDRQEQYFDKVKKYNPNTKQYEEVLETKTRTVTDWRPHSGEIEGETGTLVCNGEADWFSDALPALQSAKDDSVVEEGYATVSASGLQRAKDSCRRDMYFRILFPGDHHKDYQSSDDVQFGELICYKIPVYQVEYTYRDKQYAVCAYACGELNVSAEIPPDDVDIEEVAKQDTKLLRNITLCGWIGTAAMVLLAWILLIGASVKWSWVLPLIVYGATVAVNILHDKKHIAKLADLKGNAISLKCEQLQKVLQEKGYQPLTNDELKFFDAKSLGSSYAQSQKGNLINGKMIWGAILIFATIVASSGF